MFMKNPPLRVGSFYFIKYLAYKKLEFCKSEIYQKIYILTPICTGIVTFFKYVETNKSSLHF